MRDNSSLSLDDVDHAIIEVLRRDARLSARAVARHIGMSPGAATDRISRLEDAGVIRGYHADIDPVALGYTMRVLVSIRLEPRTPAAVVVEELLPMEEIIAMYFVLGRWDLVLLVRVRDHEHLRKVIMERLGSQDLVVFSESMVVLERHAPSAVSSYAHDGVDAVLD